jgi:hypothetical protein
MIALRMCVSLAGRRFAVPMTGPHVRREFDERCLSR